MMKNKTRTSPLEIRPGGIPRLLRIIKCQFGILHLHAELPTPKTRPEVLVVTGKLTVVIAVLGNIEPSDHSTTTVLLRDDFTPAAGAGELALAAISLGQRWEDEGTGDAEVVHPGGAQGEAGSEAPRLECGLKEWNRAGGNLGGILGVGVVREDLDGGGTVCVFGPVEASEMFGDVPVFGDVSDGV